MSPNACKGILRRSKQREKELPPTLKEALEIQAGIRKTGIENIQGGAYHINQRSEGINLNGVSGALMATQNNQMQTFITEGTTAFTQNQRDEVRDLKDIAGALGAGSGTKQQTYIAAFSSQAGGDSRGIGYEEEVSPTLNTSRSPAMVCLNDQGGSFMDVSENVSGTLRANSGNHQPLVMGSGQGNAAVDDKVCPSLTEAAGTSGGNTPILFENHAIDARYRGPLNVSPTLSAKCGTGGNNLPLVKDTTYCIAGNTINRKPENGGNGVGAQEDISYTLTTVDIPAVYAGNNLSGYKKSGVSGTQVAGQHKCITDMVITEVYNRAYCDEFNKTDVAATESARQYKDATDLVLYAQNSYSQYDKGCGTLRASGGTNGGGSESLVVGKSSAVKLIRRLTPLECERLQGFPDFWTDIQKGSDAKRYKALGNSVAIPCVTYVLRRIKEYEGETEK